MLLKNIRGLWFIGWAVFAVVSKSDLAVHTLNGNFVMGLFCAFALPGIGVSLLATGDTNSPIIYISSLAFWLVFSLLANYRGRKAGKPATAPALGGVPGVVLQYRRRTVTRYEED
jgi:hypothetical protein